MPSPYIALTLISQYQRFITGCATTRLEEHQRRLEREWLTRTAGERERLVGAAVTQELVVWDEQYVRSNPGLNKSEPYPGEQPYSPPPIRAYKTLRSLNARSVRK